MLKAINKIIPASIRQSLHLNSLHFVISGIAVSLAMMAAVLIAFIMSHRFDSAINNTAFENNARIVATAADRIDSYIMEIVRTSRVVVEMTEAFPDQENIIDNMYFLLPEDVDTIAIFSDAGELEIKTDDRVLFPPEILIKQNWYRAVAPGSRLVLLSNPHIQRLYPGEYRWVITMSRGLSWNSENQTRRSIMLVDLNLRFIDKICSGMMSENAYLYVISEDSQIIYHPRQQMIYAGVLQEDTLQDIAVNTGSNIINHKNGRLLVNIADLNNARWRVVGVSSIEGALSYDSDMPIFILVIVSLILLIVIIIALTVSFAVTRPLRRLMYSMDSVESGKLDVYSKTNRIFEVSNLTNSYNQMVARIRTLMKQVLTEQQTLRESEIRALHAQINPHFLYNTLDSMVWLAESGDRAKVVKMIESLARFFRLTLYGGKNIIPVRDELKHAESYLNIQKMRFGDKFNFIIDADPAVVDAPTMKMILQPLAENAVVHGVGSAEEGGVISIRAYLDGKDLVYEVRDNGLGMTPETIERLSGSAGELLSDSGIGIQNISQRIKLSYGEEYGLSFESEADEGVVVTVRIPVIIKEEG